MSDVKAFLAGSAYLAAETSVPLIVNGKTLQCRPPRRDEAARWLKLLAQADEGNFQAILEIYEQFPGFLGQAPEAFECLLPMEVVVLATRFFLSSRAAIMARVPTTEPMNPESA